MMAQQVKSDVGRTVQALQDRIVGVESTQREHSAEVARLQNELAGVRRELVSLREENQRQIDRVEQASQQAEQAARSNLSDLDRKVTANQSTVSALANQIDRTRIDFELQSGRTEEVAPGIYLTVKQTDVRNQRVDGWLQIAQDGRIVWLKGEGAQKQIDFSSQSDQRAYQLTFTKIGRGSATGYVLVPELKSADSSSEAN
jgi:predicted RNase H-like nuclease (RuvC/YqgF family)